MDSGEKHSSSRCFSSRFHTSSYNGSTRTMNYKMGPWGVWGVWEIILWVIWGASRMPWHVFRAQMSFFHRCERAIKKRPLKVFLFVKSYYHFKTYLKLWSGGEKSVEHAYRYNFWLIFGISGMMSGISTSLRMLWFRLCVCACVFPAYEMCWKLSR